MMDSKKLHDALSLLKYTAKLEQFEAIATVQDAVRELQAEQGGRVEEIDLRKWVRHMADVLEAGKDVLGVDAELARLGAAIQAALAQSAQGEAVALPISRDDIREMVIRLRNEDSTDDLCVEAADMLATILHADRARVPEPIIELAECRKVGWNDSAPAYRAGWNACRDAMLAAAPSQPEDAA